jgi:hypothetical protein
MDLYLIHHGPQYCRPMVVYVLSADLFFLEFVKWLAVFALMVYTTPLSGQSTDPGESLQWDEARERLFREWVEEAMGWVSEINAVVSHSMLTGKCITLNKDDISFLKPSIGMKALEPRRTCSYFIGFKIFSGGVPTVSDGRPIVEERQHWVAVNLAHCETGYNIPKKVRYEIYRIA